MNAQLVADQLIKWLKEQVTAAGCQGVVFGLSGGVDSAVVAGLASKAFGEQALGIIMPCHSDPEDAEHGELCAKAFDLPYLTIDLSEAFDQMCRTLAVQATDPQLAVANIKPRLRMTTLYFHAAKRRALVLGTGNRSELTIGYFTKHGDGGVDLMPIAGLVKRQVWQLAACLGVPQEIIDKKPSAGLWAGQDDEKEMGISYRELDDYIVTGKASEHVRERVDRLNRTSAHKRCLPPRPNIALD